MALRIRCKKPCQTEISVIVVIKINLDERGVITTVPPIRDLIANGPNDFENVARNFLRSDAEVFEPMEITL